MGIPEGSARLLLEQGKRTQYRGTVLQLGRGTVYFTESELRTWARQQDYPLAEIESVTLSHDPKLRAQGCLSDVSFFELLGFDEVRSCDIADWEDADYIFDLNQQVPAELEGRFDAIFETGTVTQIFDLPRVLSNLHRLLRVGGRMIHCSTPSNNHMDLGFAMPCPTLFSDYYSANRYQVEAQYLCEYTSFWYNDRLFTPRWEVYQYTPGCLDALSFGRYGGAQAANFVVARKTEDSRGDVAPQLGQYRTTWREFEQHGGEAERVAGQASHAAKKSFIERTFGTTGIGAVLGRSLKRASEWSKRHLLPRRMPPRLFRW